MSNAPRYVTATADDADQRIDNFLFRMLKGVPKGHVYRLLRTGQVRLNRGRVKAHHRLSAGDEIRLPPVRQAPRPDSGGRGAPEGLKRALAERVLAENDEWLVLSKPPGVPVHAGSGLSYGVIEVLRAARPGETLELAHRLDRDTSGCLLVARSRRSLRRLQQGMRDGTIGKTYTALLAGAWPEGVDRVDKPLRRDVERSGERMVEVAADGKPSRTRFRVLERLPGATLVEATLETGRTHQIRVHSQAMGCPVAGDAKYGDRGANRRLRRYGLRRFFLHASRIAVPGEEGVVEVEAPLEGDLAAVVAELRNA